MKYAMVAICIMFCCVTAYGSGYINGQWIETNGYPLWRTPEDSLQYENREYVPDSIQVAETMAWVESGDYIYNPFQVEEMFELEKGDPDLNQLGGCIEPPLTQWAPINWGFGGYWAGRGYHLGDDACRSAGTPVYAVWTGLVRYARKVGCSGNWGYLQVIEHYFGDMVFCGIYGHLGQNMYPGEGRWVYEGQYLGCIGTTSESCQSPPHLHNGIHFGPYGVPTGEYASWVQGYNKYGIPPCWASPNNFYVCF